jgi:GDP-D-mannose dehydratase
VNFRENFVAEYQRLVSDPRTMHELGWHPKISLRELAALMTGSSTVTQD